MKLENQVCSLELAKKIKELGVEQESLFFGSMHENEKENFDEEVRHIDKLYKVASAFTATELGEMLPKIINIGEKGWQTIYKHPKQNWMENYLRLGSW